MGPAVSRVLVPRRPDAANLSEASVALCGAVFIESAPPPQCCCHIAQVHWSVCGVHQSTLISGPPPPASFFSIPSYYWNTLVFLAFVLPLSLTPEKKILMIFFFFLLCDRAIALKL